jgi:hypothetical protein
MVMATEKPEVALAKWMVETVRKSFPICTPWEKMDARWRRKHVAVAKAMLKNPPHDLVKAMRKREKSP